jgi:hypothetical protein
LTTNPSGTDLVGQAPTLNPPVGAVYWCSLLVQFIGAVFGAVIGASFIGIG